LRYPTFQALEDSKLFIGCVFVLARKLRVVQEHSRIKAGGITGKVSNRESDRTHKDLITITGSRGEEWNMKTIITLTGTEILGIIFQHLLQSGDIPTKDGYLARIRANFLPEYVFSVTYESNHPGSTPSTSPGLHLTPLLPNAKKEGEKEDRIRLLRPDVEEIHRLDSKEE
jgi:hypothetical protein